MQTRRRRGVKFFIPVILILQLFFLFPLETKAIEEVPWEDYRPKLEWEMLYPVLYYNEYFYGLLYGRLSDILKEHELNFIIYANEYAEDFQYVAGYTRHFAKWSMGINAYAGSAYLGSMWNPGFYEEQTGLSILGSYHWNNEARMDLRLQWEDFEAKARSSKLEGLAEDGRVFGWEVTLNLDNHDFISQSGTRQYLSLGGGVPLFATDYNYLKLEGDHRSYHPLGERLSLIWSARGGKIWGDYPEHRGFLVGGIQNTSTSALGTLANIGLLGSLADSVLRGYDPDEFTGDGFTTSNLELRGLIYPGSYMDIGGFALSGTLFLDIGQVWRQGEPLTSDPLASWGMGLKFLILRGLLLGVDYAIPFDSEKNEKWHISLGEVF